MSTKVCTSCLIEQPITNFSNDKSKADGKRPSCRGCHRAYRKKNAVAIKEKKRDYNRRPEVRYRTYQQSARYRGFKFRLTMEQFLRHWQKPCIHCGVAIETIGLDRVDSSKPYQITNVEPCCSTCNRLKSDMDTKDWYAHMQKIMKHKGITNGNNGKTT